MNIKGDLKITRDLYIKTAAKDAKLGKILYAAGVDGNTFWQNLKLYEADTTALYAKGSVVINPEFTFVYLALVDDADGSKLDDELQWTKLIDIDKSSEVANKHIYYLNTIIPQTEEPQDVGGILRTYQFASQFRDSNQEPNQPVSAVLDSILFPVITPEKSSEEGLTMNIQGRRQGDSTVDDLDGLIVAVDEILEVHISANYLPGTWAPNGEAYLGAPVHYEFDKHGIHEETSNDYTSDILAAPTGVITYTYGVTVPYEIGGIPTDSRGAQYPSLQRSASPPSLVADSMSISFGLPIMVAMTKLKPDNSTDMSIYLNNSVLNRIQTNDLFIQESVVDIDISNYLYGLVEYPYILIPSLYGKQLVSFVDTLSGEDYTNNFDIMYDIYLNVGEHKYRYIAYVFKTNTNIVQFENSIKLTVA